MTEEVYKIKTIKLNSNISTEMDVYSKTNKLIKSTVGTKQKTSLRK